MAVKVFKVGIFSSNETIYEGEVVSLIAPSISGYLGILAGHAPLAARLKPGIITLRDSSGKPMTIELHTQGYLEVLQNKSTILFE